MTTPQLQDWIGRSEESETVIEPLRAQALQVSLGDPAPRLAAGDPLPPLWHWLYFWELAAPENLGPEGHPRLGGFLPPVELPRRMWAGSRLTFARPLRIGRSVTRRSTVQSIAEKTGRSGPLVFVTVEHSLSDDEGPAIAELHDIVYRAAPQPGPDGAPPPVKPKTDPAPGRAAWQRRLRPDPILLFRYSALTFNAHRIHYDLDFCRREEGYPGLVVHGPLLATLMVDLARRHCPDRRVGEFSFRALSPVFEGEEITVAGAPNEDLSAAELWVADGAGALAMQGRLAME